MSTQPPIPSTLIDKLASRIRAWRQQDVERTPEAEAMDYAELVASELRPNTTPDSSLIDRLQLASEGDCTAYEGGCAWWDAWHQAMDIVLKWAAEQSTPDRDGLIEKIDEESEIERVAIAISPWFNGLKDKGDPQKKWDGLHDKLKGGYRRQAKAAIQAIKAKPGTHTTGSLKADMVRASAAVRTLETPSGNGESMGYENPDLAGAPGACSEISVVDIENAIRNAQPERIIVRQELRQRDNNPIEVLHEQIEYRVTPAQQALAVYELIRPYLAKQKPVSLEECTAALWNSYQNHSHGLGEYFANKSSRPQVFKDAMASGEYDKDAKIVLDAAGVKYVG